MFQLPSQLALFVLMVPLSSVPGNCDLGEMNTASDDLSICETALVDDQTSGDPDEVDRWVSAEDSSEDGEWVEGGILTALNALGGSSSEYQELRVCDIVLAFDVQMRNAYADYQDRVAEVLNDVRTKYAEQVGIWLDDVEWIDIPADECTSLDPLVLRNQFRQYMIDHHYPKQWDCAHLFTAKNLGGYLGMSHYPGVGTERYLEDDFEDDDRGYSYSKYDGGDPRKSTSVFGHELGHIFNADHVYAHRTDNLFPIVNTCTWMWTPYRYDAYEHLHDEFSVWNANRITSWARQTLDKTLIYNDGVTSVDEKGLYVRDFKFRSDTFWNQPQSYKSVSYWIYNTNNHPVTLNWLCVAGENEVGVGSILGVEYDVVIPANSQYYYEYDWYVTRAGTYDLWPAYINYDWSRGDFDLRISASCYYLEASTQGPIAHPTTMNDDMCMFFKWYLFSTSGIMNVDTKVYAYFTLFSCQPGGDSSTVPGSAEDETVTFSDIFVACRNPTGDNRDFGGVGSTTLSYEAWTFPGLGIDGLGGGCTIEFAESRKLDSAGTWEFYPAWEYSGNYRLFDDWGIDLYISEPIVGGGCVAEGTLITMADGSKEAVEDIRKGDMILGYDPVNGTFMAEKVLEKWSTWVTQILNINSGALRVTLVDQPIYVMNSEGIASWIRNPCDLQLGWMIYNAESGQWITIVSLDTEVERAKVFDFLTDGFQTYLGNSFLLMDKGKK